MDVRPARRADVRPAHQARITTWKTAYRGIVPDDYLDTLALSEEQLTSFEDRFDSGEAHTYVAVERGIIGMAVVGPCRDEDRPGERELYALYVVPTSWGSGAGQGLWDACQPFTSLWVLADNGRARAFYERNGFRPEASKQITFAVPLTEVRYVLM